MATQDMQSRDYAAALDQHDPLHHLRKDFCIPSRADLRATSLPDLESRDAASSDESVYLCGNSLGLQPRLTATRLQQYLTTWATQGVFGHFKPIDKSPLPIWLDVDSAASMSIAPIVGAHVSEVNIMETLTANLHLLMSAFYRPDINARHKIILEGKAFPSDHYAVESQILHHGLSPAESMITIDPPPGEATITTSYILSVIKTHASTTAVLLLPGIQFYTGQLLDIPTITAAAQEAGIFVIWDLAHAVGNVPLSLHDWNVDAAAWCSYKYLNAGPGAIGGMFVHERNSQISSTASASENIDGKHFVNRFSGWWGNDKSSRFAMENRFQPIPGAAGFQLSNPSVLDITSLNASLEVFEKAGGMAALRAKSLKITAYLESLLEASPHFEKVFQILTPKDPQQRGAQISVRLNDGLLDIVMKELEERGVVVDERRPDVIRVAPAPLYNSFVDVYEFMKAFSEALDAAQKAKDGSVDPKDTKELEKTT
ncbi:kynureninase-1 [Coleophoma cylindrospora]|uniref:Kynureninase n=1 Tax=Coleophoma cylindrospora TaxID=1849047 RepID=A0A3D8SST7_9HELO|nr:kynureninase-1 [Coleophoma cylindrospora]